MSISVDIYKKLGNFELSVKFEAGNEVTALFGASGCGKSMTLRCIAGIMKPDRGRIVLNDKVLFDSEKKINLTPQKRNVGYLFQQYALFPNMTVKKNIECGLHEKNPEKVQEFIKAMHLEGMEDKYPNQLSGGQQQRTALARILVGDPDILMLDEPFSALDTHLKYQMEHEVRNVISKFGKPVLLVSHDSAEVYRLSDSISIMKDGRIEAFGDKRSIYLDPKTPNGAMLTGYRNISRARVIAPGRVYAEDWGAEVSVNGNTEGITHIAAKTESVSIGGEENLISCRVDEVICNAFSYGITIVPTCGSENVMFVVHTKNLDSQVVEGSEIQVSIPRNDIITLREN